MSLIRTFIAIPLPSPLQKRIWRETAPLRDSIERGIIRWVPPENIHLTLKFLGNTPEENSDTLKKIITREILKYPAFEISLRKIGAYPNISRPNVIWLGIEESSKLFSLQKSVEKVASQIGSLPEKRRFSAHLTLGRVSRKGYNKQSRAKIRIMLEKTPGYDFGKVRVKSIHLFESQLKESGAEYRSLFEAKLGEFFE
ncbi:MAG: RNA 2',3'-cyclic phosphodiesterase [Anaerolineae bacterium]|jgi:2'-5' RNA ligase|nr:RNA 2',3'-cyclic phosphodiesterase [Anaerolineae bacterium]